MIRTSNIFISFLTNIVVSQKYFKTPLSPFRLSTKIIEFFYVKSPKSISSKRAVWRKFLEIESNSILSKNRVFQRCKISYPFQSTSFNNVVIRKKILKSWDHISDNIAHVVGGPQYSYWWYMHIDFRLPNNCLDGFLHSTSCWIGKKHKIYFSRCLHVTLSNQFYLKRLQ